MGILLITFASCILILAIIMLIVWRKTDWKKIDEANKIFYDSDGDHVYYDRTRIRMKKEDGSQKQYWNKNINQQKHDEMEA